MASMRRPLSLAAAAMATVGFLVGCTAPKSFSSTPAPTPGRGEFGALGAEGCTPPSPTSGGEVQGTPTAQGASAFGQFQGASPLELKANDSAIKLVVRVTGSGDLGVRLTDPSGEKRQLAWGPQAHAGSNYDRPGDEWGLGLPLTRRGCWELALSRGNRAVATFWLPVG